MIFIISDAEDNAPVFCRNLRALIYDHHVGIALKHQCKTLWATAQVIGGSGNREDPFT